MFQKKHILVIDDDEKLRQLLKSFLFGQGYLVDTSEDTHTARIKMSNILYDLIILDVMLPRESGISFAEKCKNIINIPILMLSAMSEVEDRIKGLKTGVDEYLCKPFEPEELLLRIENIIKRLRELAKDNDICPDIVEKLWRFIIELSIELETEIFNKK